MRTTGFLIVTLIGVLVTAQSGCAQSKPAGVQVSEKDSGTPAVRSVKGQVLTSREMPPVRLEFDSAFKYVGTQTFELYGVANAEQHFFVDADEQGRIKRLFWIQFEGYLPNNSHTYDYKSTKLVNVGGIDFIADSFPRNLKTNPRRPNSDGARAEAFLEGKGYHLGSDNIMLQRLVHLVNEKKRDELMIIYTEDLSGLGVTAEDLGPGGTAVARWETVAAGLLDRTLKNMKLVKESR